MSCLDNTDILRIVGGNSFQIAITVKARRVSDGSEIEDFDLSASSPVLNLIHAGEKTRKYFVTQGNQAIISFDGSEGLGYYGMEMSGSYNSEAWRFCIEKVLQLVDTNAKANIPEWSFLVDDTYFIEGTISIYGGGGGGDTVQADWAETNPTSAAFILHKPDLSVYATKTEVASGLAGKQDTIVDLTSIRYGAAAGATAYQKPSSGIPESDMSEGVQTSLGKADSSYQKPSSGIPSTDMSEGVQAALEKANSAVQTETDPVFSNSPAAEISQNDINSWNAKQSAIADLADIREGAAAGATAVQPDEMAQAIDGVEGDIEDINAKIPSTASSLNQLADKAYVNSSIATNSATYRGSFNLITDLGMNIDATHAQIAGALATAIVTADNNDYAFVQIPDSASTPTVIAKIERYKHNGSGWVYEYDLNNSGFTAAQWAAINSGITSGLVGKLADLPNNSELATLLNGKQNVINDLSAIRSGAAAGATAVQPADLTEALNGVEAEIDGLDESKQDTIEDLSTIRSGAAAGATAYQKPANGIPESDMSEGVQSALDKADSAYQKPSSGIPSTDMSEGVQAALEKANSAVQTETDPVFSNSPAAEISQNDINSWNAKQSAIADLADIREGAAAGATAVQPDEMAQAIDEVDGDIADINAKIPMAASNLNQLADKAYVNSSIATNSATYRGSFNLITDLGMNVDATHAQIAGALATAITTADNNDYAFVQIPDSASTPTVIAKIERYKHNGSGWVYEYDLNNSGFTAAQWAAINSGITSGLVGKLSDLPNNSDLATLLNGKQNVINDLSAIRSGASAGATAVQPADLTEALNGVEAEIAGLDESKQDTIEDLSTIRSGAAAGATAYQKPVTGIPESDMSDGVQTSLGKADSAYQKPASGIPATDMSEGVQVALEKANSAVQTETDPVFSGSPAAEITQADINTWNSKQPAIADLADIREGAAAGATAVQPDAMAQAIDGVEGDIADINAKIPTAASNLNQLADKAYVNSSIATNSATYRGSFNLITDLGMNVDATHAQIAGALATAIVTADNNDYAFVQIPDSASTPTVIAKIERYKHNGTGWVYEYDLNNSGFTAAQWAAINSGITSGLVGKLADLPNNSELATLLNGKQNVISDLSDIREGAAAGATAVQPDELTEELNGVEAEIAGLDESKQDVIEDLSTVRSGAAAGATAYQKPSSGIPESDMSESVKSALDKANSAQTAIQNEAAARITADELLQQQYNALTQSDMIVGALPDTGVSNVIYRVPGTTTFSDYMWYNNQFVPMATYGLPISAEFVVDNNLNKTQEEVNSTLYEEINGTEGRTLVQPTSDDLISGYRGSSGKLNEGNYLHILYPVTDLRGYTISASNLPSSGVVYTMVSQIRTTSGGSIYYDACDGWSNVSEIPTNVAVPDDAEYLYILCGTTSTATVPVLSSNWEQQGTQGIKQDIDALESLNIDTRLDALEDIDYDGFVSNDEIFETKAGKNIANPANFSLTLRPVPGQMRINTSSDVYGSTGLVIVEEGKTYTVSGVANYVGGYLADGATMTRYQALVAAVEFTSTIGGKCFTVPSGQNIKYVCVCVKTNDDKTAFVETSVQIEEGDVASAYEPYSVKTLIKESLLPEGGSTPTPTGEFDELAKYTTFGLLNYTGIADKIPNFRRHWILKDKDLCVVNTGTSLTARGTAHTTARTDAAYRPPLMDLNYLPSILWDKMMWEGQQYRRYDAKTEQGGSTNMFTEVGTFATTSGLSTWDDYSPARQGYTRYSDSANASVAFPVPADAWQFNFIYRSDSQGSENCTVSINEGDGVMQVWNGSAWVEANGYTFSMKESDVTVLSSITYKNPSTEANTTINNVQVKGNTTYQKRLKMRAVTRESSKSVTIGCTSGRFMYWGVEWSSREFMITYINAARGSHNSLIANSPSTDRALIHYQDNEIWSFKPDLLLTEDPIHNSGGGNAPSSSRNSCYYANVTENFFFADNGVSMTARATALGLTVPEMVLFNTSLTYNFGAFDTDTGELDIVKQADGICWSAYDAQMSCYIGVITNHPSVVYINAIKNWVEASIRCFGNLAAATVGSNENGTTFTDEGSHWNDTGCKVMARVILPVLDFVV